MEGRHSKKILGLKLVCHLSLRTFCVLPVSALMIDDYLVFFPQPTMYGVRLTGDYKLAVGVNLGVNVC